MRNEGGGGEGLGEEGRAGGREVTRTFNFLLGIKSVFIRGKKKYVFSVSFGPAAHLMHFNPWGAGGVAQGLECGEGKHWRCAGLAAGLRLSQEIPNEYK